MVTQQKNTYNERGIKKLQDIYDLVKELTGSLNSPKRAKTGKKLRTPYDQITRILIMSFFRGFTEELDSLH